MVLATVAFGYAAIEPSLSTDPAPDSPAALRQALTTLDSPTFLVFAGLTGWLVFSVITVSRTTFAPSLVRHGTYLRAALRSIGRSIPLIISGEAASVLAAALAGVLRSPSTPNPVGIATFRGLALLVGQCGVILVALVTIRLILEVAFLRTSRRLAVIAVAVVVWVWGAASAAGFIDGNLLVDLRSYTSIEALAQHPILVPSVVAILATIWIVSVVSVRRLDGRGRVRLDWRQASDFVAGLITVAVTSLALAVSSGSLIDAYVVVLRGPGASILQSLAALVIFVGYAFVSQFRISLQLAGWGALNLIRAGSIGGYLVASLRREAIRAALYLAAVYAAVALVFLAGGGHVVSSPDVNATAILMQLAPVAFLQLMLYVLVMYAGTILSSSAAFGLLATAIFAVLSFIPFDPDDFLPVQRASIVDVFDVASSLRNVLVLAIACLAVIAALVVISRTDRARLGTRF